MLFNDYVSAVSNGPGCPVREQPVFCLPSNSTLSCVSRPGQVYLSGGNRIWGLGSIRRWALVLNR